MSRGSNYSTSMFDVRSSMFDVQGGFRFPHCGLDAAGKKELAGGLVGHVAGLFEFPFFEVNSSRLTHLVYLLNGGIAQEYS